MPEEKRCHKRYPVSGKTLFQTESQEAAGELVDIARGGVCIRSEVKPLDGEELTVRFTVQDHIGVFEIRGMVVRVQSNSWAMMFLEEPMEMETLLRSLAEKAEKQVASPTCT